MGKIFSVILILFLSSISSPSWSETLTMDDLVKREGLYYKKFSNVPFTGEVSGESSGRFKNGEFVGIWFIYYPDGQLHRKTTSENGFLNGEYVTYFKSGNVMQKGNYKDGKEDGLWEIYYENGQLDKKGNFINGKREGLWEFYYENGKLWSKRKYIDGKEDGFFKTFDRYGNVMRFGHLIEME